ncbi:MAG TPA: IS1 family transposase [Thiomicrospira sp.]|nr:IS1 family transposase [Thiomicrospira sp.]
MRCPSCGSKQVIKNGVTSSSGKQNYLCKSCRRQFVENPTHYCISDETKPLIDRLLLEKISLAGIARAVQVSERWLQRYVNERYDKTPRQVQVSTKKKRRLTLECDELRCTELAEVWSFVGEKANKQWVWLALDRDTREIVGVHIGDRGRDGAQALWESLPPAYRQCAVIYTDEWQAYKTVFPKQRHQAVGKETGLTNHIERFNNTLRQRVARLVRKTLSFSKKQANHVGAIWLFIHHYNTERQKAISLL